MKFTPWRRSMMPHCHPSWGPVVTSLSLRLWRFIWCTSLPAQAALPPSGRGWGGLGGDGSVPLEGTWDMWECFQVFPGTGRKLTFSSLCLTNRLQGSSMLLDRHMSPDCQSDFLQGAQRFERQTGWCSTNRVPVRKPWLPHCSLLDASSNLQGEQFERSCPIILFQEGYARLMISTNELNMIADFFLK